MCHQSDNIGNGFKFVKKNCISLSQSVQWDKDKKNVSSLKNNNARLLTINHEKNVIYEPFLTPLHSLRMSTNKVATVVGFQAYFFKTFPETYLFFYKFVSDLNMYPIKHLPYTKMVNFRRLWRKEVPLQHIFCSLILLIWRACIL